jgi:5-methylcytosine-specific restriction endonuclease McrA
MLRRTGFRRRPYVPGVRRTNLRTGRYYSRATTKGKKQELDNLTRWIVKIRDGCCATCGQTDPDLLEASHFFPRRFENVRWNLINVNTQCKFCNQRHGKDQQPYIAYMMKTYGEDVFEKLNVLRFSNDKYTGSQLDEMIIEHRETYRTMKAAA